MELPAKCSGEVKKKILNVRNCRERIENKAETSLWHCVRLLLWPWLEYLSNSESLIAKGI